MQHAEWYQQCSLKTWEKGHIFMRPAVVWGRVFSKSKVNWTLPFHVLRRPKSLVYAYRGLSELSLNCKIHNNFLLCHQPTSSQVWGTTSPCSAAPQSPQSCCSAGRDTCRSLVSIDLHVETYLKKQNKTKQLTSEIILCILIADSLFPFSCFLSSPPCLLSTSLCHPARPGKRFISSAPFP